MSAEAILAEAGWSGIRSEPLAGDASSRRYARLRRAGETAILMISPDTRTEPFCRVADHLFGLGLSAPKILAGDADVLLVEDLGDRIFTRHLAARPGDEGMLYDMAMVVLVHLHGHPAPGWAEPYDAPAMAAAIRPAWSAYLGQGDTPPSPAWQDVEARLGDLLDRHAASCDVLIHRDYHAENLVWMPDRTGFRRVGLLDFQDALAGHPAYDLASLLQDARRDLAPGIEEAVLAAYVERRGIAFDAFARAYALVAVQRHLRILGIFARLARERGKTGYLALQPRVHGHLMRSLAHPDLGGLRSAIAALLPAPRVAA